ncbi:MAG: bifunctional glutamate N-acetyltransferase/amino-acid acetyltransferase ArgJ [Zetaproteobacteria bacterium]|nr:bifunctional glutamate N-acetyltransferase/amino-acid acetyltransferase ArgJ [Zetaproteobacteria bacterium]
MPVNAPTLKDPLPVAGFILGTASCGVKKAELAGTRDDILLIYATVPAQAAGVLTQNRVRAACVNLAQASLASHGHDLRAIVANSGNANASTGDEGVKHAKEFILAAAHALNLQPEQVLSASTGVIGTRFPIERVTQGVKKAAKHLGDEHWEEAAHAIKTTDIFAKWASRTVGPYTITGITKGSGMIHPNMATMLAFITTDAPLDHSQLKTILSRVVDRSFNSISVDGDTSTNDSLYLMASGLGLGHAPMTDTEQFEAALLELCIELAQLIVRDGEGVSKFVTIEVTGAKSEADARIVGRTIATSSLVKTAFAGSDANWGRILAAIGNSGIAVHEDDISLAADHVQILKNGQPHPEYTDAQGMDIFANDEFKLTIDLGMGDASATVWTGDLTHDYITINAEYRT